MFLVTKFVEKGSISLFPGAALGVQWSTLLENTFWVLLGIVAVDDVLNFLLEQRIGASFVL